MVKFLVMDVDGTLTDGKIYMGAEGEIFKGFDVKDGYGIKDRLPIYDILPIVITARESKIVLNRCKELNITGLYQGVQDKLQKLKEIIREYNMRKNSDYTLKDCAYMGDDLLDLPCMEEIKKAGGIIGCPRDAVEEVKKKSDFVSYYNGGNGAVRDFIEVLIKKET